MLRQVTHEDCLRCKSSEYTYNTEGVLLLVCTSKGSLYPNCFKPEDWRDAVKLDEGDKSLEGDARRKQAEKENPHIVEIMKQNRKEREYKQAYARVMAKIKQNRGRI